MRLTKRALRVGWSHAETTRNRRTLGVGGAAPPQGTSQTEGRHRPRVDDRAALTGILFVLKAGVPWEMLPQGMGCGSGMTCWRRLRDWHEAGVWERLHEALLDRLGEADRIDWERASLDSAVVPAPGGRKGRPQPDGSRQTGLEAPPPCGRPRGRPARGGAIGGQRPRLEDARGGRGRDPADPRAAAGQAWPPAQAPEEAARRQGLRFLPLPGKALRKRGIKSRIARRGVDSSGRLGRHRWGCSSGPPCRG